MSTVPTRATADDLYRVEGKAELIGGRVVEFIATGIRPSEVASNIFMSLKQFARTPKLGLAFNDNLGYLVPELTSTRESFCPDVTSYSGPLPTNRMRFVEGALTFAVVVRSGNDDGPAAELDMASKRDDCFEAGMLAVWDVDPVSEQIGLDAADKPDRPVVFRRGQIANAATAVPGWSVPVDEVFATDL